MTFNEACNILGVRFRTSRPKRSQIDDAYRDFIAHGENVNTTTMAAALKAKNVIWEHWYSHVEFKVKADKYLCIDIAKRIYAEVPYELGGTDVAYYAYLELVNNPRPLPLPPADFDWREACMKILDGVGDAEGVWFEGHWKMDPDIVFQIENEYDRWSEEQKKK